MATTPAGLRGPGGGRGRGPELLARFGHPHLAPVRPGRVQRGRRQRRRAGPVAGHVVEARGHVQQGTDSRVLPQHCLLWTRVRTGSRRRPQSYFDKHAASLTLAQAIVLAGLIDVARRWAVRPERGPRFGPAPLPHRRRPDGDARRDHQRRPCRRCGFPGCSATTRPSSSPPWTSRPGWSCPRCWPSCARPTPFRGQAAGLSSRTAGYTIVTTVDARAQAAARADGRRDGHRFADEGPTGQPAGGGGRGRTGNRPRAGLLRWAQRGRRRLRRDRTTRPTARWPASGPTRRARRWASSPWPPRWTAGSR